MKTMTRVAAMIAVGISLCLTMSLMGQQPRKVDDAALKSAGKSGDEWLSYGLTPGETRYSPLKQIDATNVSRVGLAWSYEISFGGGGNQEATPLFWNGTIYSLTNWSIVYAVDARTGKEKWHWDPEVNQEKVRSKACCGIVHRGLALYNGKIIAPILDGRLEALDAMTGKPVWEARVSYTQDNYTLTMAPRIANGKVIIGAAGAEYPVRGFIAGFDAETGRFAWRFYTVPGDPSKPFENEAMRKAAETWDADALKKYNGVGGSVWDSIAYDPDTNLIYFGTGNAGPWPQDLRGGPGKDNLYAASVLALNATTGEYKWHFQMVPGDEWDYDSVQQLILADMTIRGQQRKVIMQANKDGFYYVIDRVSGKFISGQPYAQVNWAKGLNEDTGRPIINKEAYYSEKESVTVMPGAGGAHNWSPMSFNPNTGLVYIPTTSSSSGTYSVSTTFNYDPTRQNMGVQMGGRGAGGGAGAGAGRGGAVATDSPEAIAARAAAAAAAAAPPAAGPPKPVQRPDLPKIGPDTMGGSLVAYDPVTQKERWHAEGGGGIGGGTVTTAGNLVIQVLNTGKLRAYTADKGEKLLDIDTPARNGMGPPITFMLDGRQYIALNGGTGQFAGGGRGGPAGPPPAPNAPPPPPPAKPQLMVFMVDGKATK